MNDIPDLPRGQFSRLYADLTGYRIAVGEPMLLPRADSALREKVVRCLWFDQFLDSGNLHLEDGRKMVIFSPGYWSEGPGPDFRNAEFAIEDGPRVRGDVELHVNAGEWNQHGHATDPAYERVMLHVILHNDLGDSVIRHGDRAIPQFSIERHLSADLNDILLSLDPDGYPRAGCGREGTCCRSIRAAGRDERWVGRFLDIAGDERMLRKADRFATLMEKRTPDEVLYDALMDVMGYSVNRRPFRLLASAVPLPLLRRYVPADAGTADRIAAIQSLLFGAAGFLDAPPTADSAECGETADPATRDYLASLRPLWVTAQRECNCASIGLTSWSYRTRPGNYPARRITAISAVLAAGLHSGLCRAMMSAVEKIQPDAKERRAHMIELFRSLFEEPPQAYWSHRTRFGAATLSRPLSLLGETRASEMIVNVAIPLLLALARRDDHARVEQRLHTLYCCFRSDSENAVTKYMKSRLFENAECAGRVVTSMRRQQGLIQIFRDYCESTTATCEACGFLAAIEK